jgi:thioredoxin reductase (NADPH)
VSAQEYTVVIAGGGMAGLSCALFLARADVTVAVFDTERSSLRRVSRLNNYLGFPEGIPGSELLDLSRRQAERFGAHVFAANIETAERRDGCFVVKTADGVCSSDYFVIASNKRTDLATALGLPLGGFGSKFVSVDAEGRTAVENCYAAGRITGLPSQAVISAGDGAKAAIAIIQKIRGEYYVDHDT